jgi:S1-C subfamily serine protease
MDRSVVLGALLLVMPCVSSGQTLSVLHVKVVLVDANQKLTPVPRHGLLISDNPATEAPRLIVTAADGTVNVRLRPGNYTVESDQPVAFGGKAYQWTQTLDIAAGQDSVLELTADNAEIVEPVASGPTAAAPLEADPAFLLPEWQDSVVALWTADTRASGFVVDAKGLVATNQRVIGTAMAVEVQLTPNIKVAARVLAADPARDVAILWIDPKVAATVRPVPLGCAQTAKRSVVVGQKIFTIGAPLREQKGMTSGTVSHVEQHAIASDLLVGTGSVGGPVFAAGGEVIGISSVGDEKERRGRLDSRVIPVDTVCEVIASAENKMNAAAPPNGTHLPVEPVRPFPVAALEDAAKRRAGSMSPYQMSSADFDVAFITPVMTYGAKRSGPLTDFSNWSEYVADFPPVLLLRVTPRLVESFWTTIARGAARVQGVALPPIKHFKPGFSRLRAFCGDAEVIPIHPFKMEQRVSESDAIHEGLYVFDPGALGPQCGSVKLVLYSEKEPEKGDTREVDPKVLQQIWRDFAPYRAQ